MWRRKATETNNMSLAVEHWFPTPIWYTTIPDITDEEEAKAIKYCKKLRSKSPGRQLSNVGGWQSNDIPLNEIADTPLHKYFNSVYNTAGECLSQLGINKKYYIDNAWININGEGNYNSVHTHPNSFLSGVFYLTNNNSGLVFVRPAGIDTYSLEMHHSNFDTFLSYNKVTYKPESKVLYLFPSWLPHRVEENKTKGERISIAFNINLMFNK